MQKATRFNKTWQMKWVVPYLLKYHFGNKPTSNEDLSNAFWKLMGRNIEVSGIRRWTTGETGVPYNIHKLTESHILIDVPNAEHSSLSLEYPEFRDSYKIGPKAEVEIDVFVSKYGKGVIDKEISDYIGHK